MIVSGVVTPNYSASVSSWFTSRDSVIPAAREPPAKSWTLQRVTGKLHLLVETGRPQAARKAEGMRTTSLCGDESKRLDSRAKVPWLKYLARKKNTISQTQRNSV